MFETIMVPVDGSKYDEKAIDVAIEIASKFNSKIAAVHVLEEFSLNSYEEEEVLGDKLLANVTLKSKEKGIDVVEHLITGDPLRDMQTIIRKSGADLVILSSHGKHTFNEEFPETKIGSVAARAIETSEVPILLIK